MQTKHPPSMHRNITMGLKGSNHVAIAGSDNKRHTRLILVEPQSGEILPFQIIYQGKTA